MDSCFLLNINQVFNLYINCNSEAITLVHTLFIHILPIMEVLRSHACGSGSIDFGSVPMY